MRTRWLNRARRMTHTRPASPTVSVGSMRCSAAEEKSFSKKPATDLLGELEYSNGLFRQRGW